jgi:hypothetical protein
VSTTERIKVRSTRARALPVGAVTDLGRTTGQAERLRTATPHRVLLAIVSTLACAKVESLAELLANARRPNVERDRRTGRLRAGSALLEATK